MTDGQKRPWPNQQDWDAFDAKNRVERDGFIHGERGPMGMTPEGAGGKLMGARLMDEAKNLGLPMDQVSQQGSVTPESAGRYLNSYEMLRQTALMLERRAAGLRELADMLQALSMVRGISESQNVAALIRSVCESHR